MSVAAMTIDEHPTIVKSEPNHKELLHKLKSGSGTIDNAVNSSKVLPDIGAGGVGGTPDRLHTPASPNHHHSSSLEQHCRLLEEENQSLKTEQSRLQQQCADAQRRERILMRRLANKEQEFQDYVSQIAEYKAAQAPGPAALRSALLDPAVNLLFEKLKKELQATKAKLEETQNELSAWKFTPDSNTGKRLMAKCRLLYQENEELGKMTSNGRLAKLENELAMQKSFSEEVKKSQSELDDYLQELDEDVEGMQSTILYLQQELKATTDKIHYLEKENFQLKNGGLINDDDDEESKNLIVNGKGTEQDLQIDDHLETSKKIEQLDENESRGQFADEEQTVANNFNIHKSNLPTIDENSPLRTNNSGSIKVCSSSELFNNELTTATNGETQADCVDGLPVDFSNNSSVVGKGKMNLRKRNYDSDSSESGSANGVGGARGNGSVVGVGAKKIKKKTRRSSVLSIDLNEEDTQIAEQSDEENASNQRIITRRKSARNLPNGAAATDAN